MNNKHPHYDLIVEWAKDTSKKWQFLDYERWRDCGEGGPVWDAEGKYREKPREFTKGHWYPCLDKRTGLFNVLIYDGHYFHSNSGLKGAEFSSEMFEEIGKSLGEIKFNG